LAESGASDQTIMAIAGHVSPKMLAHYSRVRLDAKRQALDALSNRTDGAVASQTTTQKEQLEPQVLDLVVDVTGIEPVTPCLVSRCFVCFGGLWFKSDLCNQSFFSVNHFRKPCKHPNL
jgi:uncharacterized protein (DUF849 family)